MRPIIVLAAETKEGYSIESRYQDFVKIVCREFSLDLDKVLWITYSLVSDDMKVAVFEHRTQVGPEMLVSIKWRSLMPNEYEEIKRLLQDGIFD